MLGLSAILGTGCVTSCILVAAITLVTYYFLAYSRHPSNYPPIPCRPLPLLGHSLYIKGKQTQMLLAWRKKLGDVFAFYVGSRLYVCLSSYAMIKEAFLKQAEAFSEKPDGFSVRMLAESSEGKLIGLGGPDWREHRNLALTILKDFGMGKNMLALKIREEVDLYLRALADFRGQVIPSIKSLTNAAVCNVITAILVGHRYEYDDVEYQKIIGKSSKRLSLMVTSSILSVWQWLEKLPGDLFNAKMMKDLTKEIVKSFYEVHIKSAQEELETSDKDNFLKAFLAEMRKRKASDKETSLTVDSLRSTMDILHVAGTDTTSTTLQWAMVYAMNFPDVAKKVYDEIEEVVGLQRPTTMADKANMPYTNAFILETQRKASIIPLGSAHECSETRTVGGYTVPQGTVILAHLDAIFADEKTWGDPDNFRPERFLDGQGNVVAPEQLMPFSIGKRACLGEALAKMELFLFVSSVFQRFYVQPEVEGQPPSMERVVGLTAAPVPFRLRLVERQGS